MPTIADLRLRLPELEGLSDDQAVDVIQQVYYPERDRASIAQSLGYKPAAPSTPPATLWERTKRGLGSTVNASQIATAGQGDVAALVAEEARNQLPSSPAALQMQEDIKPYVKRANEAEGFGDNVGAWSMLAAKRLGQFITNPREAAGMIAESLPNSAPGMAGMLAGGYAGSVAGPVGAAVGSIAGGTVGGYVIENGAAMRDQIMKEAQARGIDARNPDALAPLIAEKYDEFLQAARLKGAGTAATDAVLTRLTMGLAGMGERAVVKGAGASTAALKAGTKTAAEGAEDLARLTAQQAGRNTLPRKVARGAGVTVMEMGGESLSEAGGQIAAYGKADAGDVVDEGLLGAGQGVLTASTRGLYAKTVGATETDAADNSLRQLGEAVQARQTPLPPAATESAAKILDAETLEEATARGMATVTTPKIGKPPAGMSVPKEGEAPFGDRVLTVREQIADPATREAIRAKLGPDALADVSYYAGAADNTAVNIPDKTRERMLSLAEAIVQRATLTPLAQPGAVGSDAFGMDALAGPGAGPARIGLDTAPTGTMRVDAAGNVAPETRADAISTADAQRAGQVQRAGMEGQGRRASAVYADPAPAPRPPAPDVPRAARTGSATPATIDTEGPNAVAQFIERQRGTNTPAARAFVQAFEAGRVTPSEVMARITRQPTPEPTADQRLAAAAAQAPRVQPGDLLTVDGFPYGTKTAASVRARKEGGSVVEVPGGFAVRKEIASVEPVVPADAPVADRAADGAGNQPGGSGGTVGRVAADGRAGNGLGAQQQAPAERGGANELVDGRGSDGAALTPDRADPMFEQKNTLRQLQNTVASDVDPQGGPLRADRRESYQRSIKQLQDEIAAKEAPTNAPTPQAQPQAPAGEAPAPRGTGAAAPAVVPGAGTADSQAGGVEARAVAEFNAPVSDSLIETVGTGIAQRLRRVASPIKGVDGWRMAEQDSVSKVVLVSKTGNEIAVFPYQQGSGTDKRRAIAKASVWAAEQEGATPNAETPVQAPSTGGAEAPAVSAPESDDDRMARIRATPPAQRTDADLNWSRARSDAEMKQRADAERAEREAKKEASKPRNIKQRAAAFTLDQPTKLPPGAGLGTGTRRDAMDKAVEQSRAVVETQVEDPAARKRDQEAIEDGRRRDMIPNLTNPNFPGMKELNEAADRLKANKYRKTEYRVYGGSKPDGGHYAISKTEYDYAQERKAIPQNEPAIPAVSAQKVQEGAEKQAGIKPELEPAKSTLDLQPAAATHKDPGEPAEVVTPAVVAEAIKTAAKNEDMTRGQMKVEALRLIDMAIAKAPEKGDKKITISVPGDGAFTVVNNVARLKEFRRQVELSPGFKDKQPGFPISKVVTSGDASPNTLAREMLDDGEPLNAIEVLDAAGTPMMFGNGNGAAIPYTNAEATKMGAANVFVGRGWSTKKGNTSWWSVIHTASGLQIGNGGSKAEALADAKKKLADPKNADRLARIEAQGYSDTEKIPFKTQAELREDFVTAAEATQQSTFTASDATRARVAEMNAKEKTRDEFYQSIMGKDARRPTDWQTGGLVPFLNEAQKQGKVTDATDWIRELLDPERFTWLNPAIQRWMSAGKVNTLQVGYTELKLPSPPHEMSFAEIEPIIVAATYVPASVSARERMMRPWQEAHLEAVKAIVERGGKVPDKVLYNYPRLIRDDLSDDDGDKASDAMSAQFAKDNPLGGNLGAAPNDYSGAVQAYRDWGKKKERAKPVAVAAPEPVPAAEPAATAATPEAPAGRTYLAVPFESKEFAKRSGAKWDADKKLWYADPITTGPAAGEININLTQFIPTDYSGQSEYNFYGKDVASAVAANATLRTGAEHEARRRKTPDGGMSWSALPVGDETTQEATPAEQAPGRDEPTIELRKRLSVLRSLLECVG